MKRILTTLFLILIETKNAYALNQQTFEPTSSYIINPDSTLAHAEYNVEPLFIALFGDSVSLATMADAELGKPGPRFYADYIASVSGLQLYLNTVGKLKKLSEIEQHEMLTRFFGNMARTRLSPYLGTQKYSLPVLIEDLTGEKPKIYNGAQMGASYHFGQLYLDKFESFFRRNPFHKKPEVVIVNFNGMDFIDNRSFVEFNLTVKAFFERLTKITNSSNLVVTDLSDPIPLLTHPDRVSVPNSPIGAIKCSQLYEMVRFGNGTGIYPGASDEAVLVAKARLEAFRKILHDETQALVERKGSYENFRGRVIFVPAIDDASAAADHIAADCIHPDAQTQEVIGWRIWEFMSSLF